MADNARAKRLADLIREVVAQKLQRGIKDPRLGSHVTITDTRVTGDLREATVFYTVYGDDEERRPRPRAWRAPRACSVPRSARRRA